MQCRLHLPSQGSLVSFCEAPDTGDHWKQDDELGGPLVWSGMVIPYVPKIDSFSGIYYTGLHIESNLEVLRKTPWSQLKVSLCPDFRFCLCIAYVAMNAFYCSVCTADTGQSRHILSIAYTILNCICAMHCHKLQCAAYVLSLALLYYTRYSRAYSSDAGLL